MPYRSAAGILMALAGLVAVAGLVLIGIDVYAAKQRGPRWKRRLLGAGLAVFGILGVWLAKPKPVVACYMHRPEPFTAPSLQRLESQASLLGQLISTGKLDPEVARKALAATEAALVDASKEEVVNGLSPTERGRAENLRLSIWWTIEKTRIRLEGGDPGLVGSLDWLKLAAAWGEAEEIVSGRRGQYPFDAAGKKRALDRLTQVGPDAERLAKTGLLNAPEAELLRQGAAALADQVARFRTTEQGGAMCYAPMILPVWGSAARLTDRLPLLQKLASADKLQPAAVRKVLAAVERDLAILDQKGALESLDAPTRAKAETTREAVRVEVEKVKKLLDATAKPAASLEASPDWKVIADAWDFAMPFARSGQSTEAQRKQIDDKLAAAREAAKRLVSAGLLSAKEAELLTSEAEKALKDIRRNPPVDPMVLCYRMVYVPPERLSLQAISARLPTIEALIKDGKIHPAAIGKVLEAIEADLVTLTDEKRRAELGDQTSKEEADKLRETIKAQLDKLKQQLADGK
jgi:hypothetical protein